MLGTKVGFMEFPKNGNKKRNFKLNFSIHVGFHMDALKKMSKDGRQKWTWMTFFFLNPISYAYSFISWKIMKFVSNS